VAGHALGRTGDEQITQIPNQNKKLAPNNLSNGKNPTVSPDGGNLVAKNAPQPSPCDKLGASQQCATGTGGALALTPISGGGSAATTSAGATNGGSIGTSGGAGGTTDGGTAALEALQAPDAKFDVVITDLDMPEVDGWAVAASVKSLSPGTHIVMLTGWAGEIAPADFKQRGVDVVLSKPCSRAELESAIGSLLVARPASGFQVLLVDDEAAFARAVRDLLTLQGHQVTVVDSARAALELSASHTFDVVLTDYSLGEVTGAELAERLADRGDGPFVVLMTGYAIQIDDPRLLSRGVNAVLPKPCRGNDLRAVLARVPSQA